MNWQIPVNASGYYHIKFQNLDTFDKMNWIGDCDSGFQHQLSSTDCDSKTYDAGRLHSIYDYACQTTFSGTGDMSNTWVRIGTINSQGTAVQYQDYTITTTAKKGSGSPVSITAGLRESPGASIWWGEHTVEIISWQVTYR
jgi:hypothetical protein